jgi:hypothetical protein
MFVSTRQRLAAIPDQPEILVNDNKIERVKTYKRLGVEIDELLSWDAYTAMITIKVTKVIGTLKRLKSYLPQPVLIQIYKSLI